MYVGAHLDAYVHCHVSNTPELDVYVAFAFMRMSCVGMRLQLE